MEPVNKFIEYGLLEMYALGQVSEEERVLVESMIRAHQEVRDEWALIQKSLEQYSNIHEISPPKNTKALLMAIVDYSERIRNGEIPEMPPELSPRSRPDDFIKWTSRKDLSSPDDFEDQFARIISYRAEEVTAIVWVKHSTPKEIHDHEIEKFLILEGSCDLIIDQSKISLGAGDFYQIPLHMNHSVEVTSQIPCKAILQRVTVQ